MSLKTIVFFLIIYFAFWWVLSLIIYEEKTSTHFKVMKGKIMQELYGLSLKCLSKDSCGKTWFQEVIWSQDAMLSSGLILYEFRAQVKGAPNKRMPLEDAPVLFLSLYAVMGWVAFFHTTLLPTQGCLEVKHLKLYKRKYASHAVNFRCQVFCSATGKLNKPPTFQIVKELILILVTVSGKFKNDDIDELAPVSSSSSQFTNCQCLCAHVGLLDLGCVSLI